MPKDELLHVRFERGEAIQSQRDFLSSQMFLLKMAGIMEDYNALRDREFKTKSALRTKTKDLKLAIGRLHKILPSPEIPDSIKREKKKEDKVEYEPKKRTNYTPDVEEQLREIERRLHRLQN